MMTVYVYSTNVVGMKDIYKGSIDVLALESLGILL